MSETRSAAHARDIGLLERIEGPARAFEAAWLSGRLHHAWLLTGPRGLGKASFAYRAARRLLGAAPDPASGPLGAPFDDPVSRLVAAQTHPDLLTLEPGGDDGKAKGITVDQARRAPAFFAMAPAVAPFRVAIIDAVDDMNANAENALLKTLEEPSGRGVLLLVSHAPGRLLPTIRSRCRRLPFAPWPDGAVAQFAVGRLGIDEQDAAVLARMARGAPGRALTLYEAGALDVAAQARDLMAALPGAASDRLGELNGTFRGAEGAVRFALLVEHLRAAIRAGAVTGEGGAVDRWGRASERLGLLQAQVDEVNLDRGDAFWAAIAELRAASEVTPLPC